MKIAFVFDDSLDTEDGIQQYMFALQRFYTAQGHDVHYLVGQTARTDIPNVHSLSRNIKVKFNGNRLSIPLWAPKKRVREVLQRENFDIIHVQVPYHPLMAGRIMRAAGPNTTVFGTFHVAPYSGLAVLGSRMLGLWSKPSLKRFNMLVSVSPAAADLCRRTFGIETEVVPNVFDYARFRDAQPMPELNDAIPTIAFLGRLVPRKGCLVLLQAIAQLPTDLKFRVAISGSGPLEAQLKAYVDQHKLGNKVTFLGRVSEADKPAFFAAADITVFPSSAGESFGIVLIEAMASGSAAVLGGDNPGYRSVLGERPDQLFNPADPTELAQRLQELLNNEPARKAAADWGRQASAQYDVTTVGAKLLTLYQKVAPNSNKES